MEDKIMYKLKDHNIYIGTKEEYTQARYLEFNIVCALNRCDKSAGLVSHQSIVGWTGRGCNKDNPHYLFKREDKGIYLNMIDGEDPAYIHDDMINAALEFMKEKLDNDEPVFVYCSLAESRSPSIVLMYLLENDLIEKNEMTFLTFKKEYTNYKPGLGNFLYIKNRWGI